MVLYLLNNMEKHLSSILRTETMIIHFALSLLTVLPICSYFLFFFFFFDTGSVSVLIPTFPFVIATYIFLSLVFTASRLMSKCLL